MPGYYMELWLKDFPACSYVIDAVDAPDVLFRKNLTSQIAFKYRVHNTRDAISRPEDGPAPGTPHPIGAPDGFHPINLQNSLVGMFFHVNWLHDRRYEAGSDEASGNALQDNYGRGGVGGDPILVVESFDTP